MKRALLIASPFGKLEGPVNDVKSVADLLQRHGFNVTQCCGAAATRDKILYHWNNLISKTERNDMVVVFYSGHGGMVDSPPILSENTGAGTAALRRYQFIVPMDYGNNTPEKFHGILDVELSILVRKTTDKTKNVTIIFDCCHSGRMARDPRHGANAIPRALPHVERQDLSSHIARLRESGELNIQNYSSLEGNEHAVRLVAAADSETAWEYVDDRGQRVGAFTKALVPAIDVALAAGVSWKNVLLRVREQVNCEFPEQHPQAEGPHERLIFSWEIKESSALAVTQEDGEVFIKAGRVAGVREGNTYVLMPHGSQEIVEAEKLAEARVRDMTAFRAFLRLPSGFRLPEEGALAYLKTEVPYQWPIAFSKELKSFNQRLMESKFIRPEEDSDGGMVIARIHKEGNSIYVYNGSHTKCASFEFESDDRILDRVEDAVDHTEHFARAEHLFALKAPYHELLKHRLYITFRSASRQQEISLDGTGKIKVGDGANLTLHNKGDEAIFVSVFNVNVAGRIFHLSRASPEGIRLATGEQYTLGQHQYSDDRPGLRMSWPKGLPRDLDGPITESFVSIVTSDPVDLRDFAHARRGEPRGNASQLEMLARHLAYAQGRDCDAERAIREIKWDMVRVPFLLCQKSSNQE